MAALAVSVAVAIAVAGLDWTPDKTLLILLVPSLVIGRARRYLLDFVPFALAIVAYAELRGLAHVLVPHPFYIPQIRLERALFGSPIPTVALQHALWHGGTRWYDAASTAILQLHTVAPPIVGYLLWLRRRALFYRFTAAILTLSFAAAVVFVVFPAAPPWAASRAGAIGHVMQLPLTKTVATSALAGTSASWSFLIPKNPYAAIPSLHAGYAFLLALFLACLFLRSGLRYRFLAVAACAVYPVAQSLAIVYTGNHYVVDILCGYAFAAASLWAVNRSWRILSLPN